MVIDMSFTGIIMYPGGPAARSFRLVRLQALRWYRVRVRSLAPQRRWISDAQLHGGYKGERSEKKHLLVWVIRARDLFFSSFIWIRSFQLTMSDLKEPRL